MENNILEKIKKAGLVGRGGAGFPTAIKWESVRNAKGDKKYVICNASEGELGLFKDIYVLRNHPEKVFEGIKLAMDFVGTNEAYFNFNHQYYSEVKPSIDKLIEEYQKKGYRFTVFEEEPSYIGGEETALLNSIEGKRLEPRIKPPFPSDAGLYGCPTLVHNVETLYNICDVYHDEFGHKRFYQISGEGVGGKQVHHLPDDWTIMKILQETDNVPEFDYFVQIGGSCSGVVLNKDQLADQKMIGAGSIEIYPAEKTAIEMLEKWINFYNKQSCGKCTPCREGTYQLCKILTSIKGCSPSACSCCSMGCRPRDVSQDIPWDEIFEILETMEITSFCALGRSVIVPVRSYYENILNKKK